jgi:hypothetical protein
VSSWCDAASYFGANAHSPKNQSNARLFWQASAAPGVLEPRRRFIELRSSAKESVRQKKALPYCRKTRTCAHMNKTPTQPYRSPPRTTSTVFELGSQEKTQAPVAAYIAMTAGAKTVNWIIMAGHSSKV